MSEGILIIDKPAGWTSHDVVARVRRILRERRVGHTGTLDPFATGVLVVIVGRATRLAQFLSGAEKEYDALIRFGYATDTGDLTGTPLAAAADAPRARACASFDGARIEAALSGLRGEIEQTPPMYSAKKVKGEKLYELARRGERVERAAVRVTVREFEAVPTDGALLRENEDGTCDMRARVVCSAGTYVRTLAESLGERLGVGAHLAALRRTRAGAFRIEAAHRLEDLEASARRADEQGMTDRPQDDAGETAGRADASARGGGSQATPLSRALLPLDAALSEMPAVHLKGDEARRARNGAAVRVGAWPAADLSEGAHVRMYDEAGRLLGVGVSTAAQQVRPRVLLFAQEE